MSEYGIVIFDDGVVIDRETEDTQGDARTVAEGLIDYWNERRPRGDYSWTIYDVDTDETVEYSDE